MAKLTVRRVLGIGGQAGLWLLTAFVAMGLWDAGLGKFTSAAGWQHWFVEVWGYPTWFRSVIGVSEASGAVLLIVPATASYAAALLSVIMLGAFWTVTTKETDLSAVDPMVTAIVLLIVLAARWPRRYRFAHDAKD